MHYALNAYNVGISNSRLLYEQKGLERFMLLHKKKEVPKGKIIKSDHHSTR